jgi:hypothetical protein
MVLCPKTPNLSSRSENDAQCIARAAQTLEAKITYPAGESALGLSSLKGGNLAYIILAAKRNKDTFLIRTVTTGVGD